MDDSVTKVGVSKSGKISEEEIEAALALAAEQLSDELIAEAKAMPVEAPASRAARAPSPTRPGASHGTQADASVNDPFAHRETFQMEEVAPKQVSKPSRPSPPPALADRTKVAKNSQLALQQSSNSAIARYVEEEPAIYVRGTPFLRFLGVALMLSGLLMAVLVGPIVGYSTAGAGALCFALGFLGRKRLGPAAGDMGQDIPRLRRQIMAWKMIMFMGVTVALVCLGLTFIDEARPYLFAAAAGALVLAAIGYSRMPVLLRSLVQATVIARTGFTGSPELARVMRALDMLLGTIPESALRKFSIMEESQMYLEILDSLENK